MIHFWHLPQITREQVERRRKADEALAAAKALNRKADDVVNKTRRMVQDNHFSQAIFGRPRD